MAGILHLGCSPAVLGYNPSLVETAVGGGRYIPELDDFCFGKTGAALGETAGISLELPEPSTDLWIMWREYHSSGVSNFTAWDNYDNMPLFSATARSVGGTGTVTRTVAELIGTFYSSGWPRKSLAADLPNQSPASSVIDFPHVSGEAWYALHCEVATNAGGTGATVNVSLYRNGVSVGTVSSFSTSLADYALVSFGLAVPLRYSSTVEDAEAYVSHIAVADGIDLRNRRFARYKPNAQGYINEWSGNISGLADKSPLTGVQSNAAGERVALDVTPAHTTLLGGSPAGLILQGAGAGDFGNTVTPFARIGTTNYDQTAVPMQGTTKSVIASLPVNPATGLAWTASDIAAAEFGFLSGVVT